MRRPVQSLHFISLSERTVEFNLKINEIIFIQILSVHDHSPTSSLLNLCSMVLVPL
jgi:hypothetical protein